MSSNRAVAYNGHGVDVIDIDYPTFELKDGPGVNPDNVGRPVRHGVILKTVSTNICGSDQHMVRGRTTAPEGLVLGHEITGEVVEVGPDVEFIKVGDVVSVPFNIACGRCRNCKERKTGICLNVNPDRPGSAYGYVDMGGWVGGQAEYVLVPYADWNLLKFPDRDQALEKILDLTMLSDIFPTGFHGCVTAGVGVGSTVYIAGAGPVGLLTIASAQLQGAGRVFCVDREPDRLARARDLGAEPVDLSGEDVVEVLRDLTGGPGPDAVVDAVGVDAVGPDGQPDATAATELELAAVAKAGTVSLIGVYPPEVQQFAIGQAMNKNLTLRMGNCNHHRYIPDLLRRVRTGEIAPARIISQDMDLTDAVEAYRTFDQHGRGWQKVVFDPAA